MTARLWGLLDRHKGPIAVVGLVLVAITVTLEFGWRAVIAVFLCSAAGVAFVHFRNDI